MKSPKTFLIILLALTTLGGATLAWRQYQELVALRAAVTSGDERADLQKKIWDLQKANRALQDELAALRSRNENGDEVAGDMPGDRPPGAETRGPRGARGGRGQQFAAMRELMAKPEVQALMSSAQKSMIDSRYAALFRTLNLPADQADKLKALLVERQNSFQDVLAAARDQGVDPRTDRDGFQKLLSDAQNTVNDSIKALIGDSGFSQLQNYDQTMPQRNVVTALQQKLSSTENPLSSSQADQLVQILAANAPQQASTNNGTNQRGGDFGGMMRGGLGVAFGGGGGIGAIVGPGSASITTDAINAATAQNILTAPQAAALQQLQQQQQTVQQLQQIMRSAWQQNGANTTGGTGSTSGSGTGGTRRSGGG